MAYFMERRGYGRENHYKRRRHRRNILFTAAAAIILALGGMAFASFFLKREFFNSTSVIESNDKENFGRGISNIKVDLEHLYSPYAILVDLESGNVLAEHDAQAKIYPASLTKIMTAVLAIENTENMQEVS